MEEWTLTGGEWIDIELLDKCYKYYYDSVEDYADAAKTHHNAQDNFASTTEWKGKDAAAAKHLVGQIEKDILKDIVKLQNDQKDFLADYRKGFYQKVDSHPQAKISVDFLNELLAEMTTIRTSYKRIAGDLEAESYDIKSRFGHYGTVTPLDFSETMIAFDRICGSSYSNGIIQDTIDDFLDYDRAAANALDSADFEGRINNINERISSLKGNGDVSAIALSTTKSSIKAVKPKNKMYKILQNEYSFTDEEMKYLIHNYTGLLDSLYGAYLFSSKDASIIYSRIRDKLFVVSFYSEYKLTSAQKQYVNNLSNLIGISDKYTLKRVQELQVTCIALFSIGESPEFISGVLGNIVHEAGVANIENIAYRNKAARPSYIKNFLDYASERGYSNVERDLSGWDNYLYDNNLYNKYVPLIHDYVDAGPKGGKVLGFGECQWTYEDRVSKLLDFYNQVDSDKNGLLSRREAMHAEINMIIYELTDNKSEFSKIDEDFNKNKIDDEPVNNIDLVRQGALDFREKYEKSRFPEPERADSAELIYKKMMGL